MLDKESRVPKWLKEAATNNKVEKKAAKRLKTETKSLNIVLNFTVPVTHETWENDEKEISNHFEIDYSDAVRKKIDKVVMEAVSTKFGIKVNEVGGWTMGYPESMVDKYNL